MGRNSSPPRKRTRLSQQFSFSKYDDLSDETNENKRFFIKSTLTLNSLSQRLSLRSELRRDEQLSTQLANRTRLTRSSVRAVKQKNDTPDDHKLKSDDSEDELKRSKAGHLSDNVNRKSRQNRKSDDYSEDELISSRSKAGHLSGNVYRKSRQNRKSDDYSEDELISSRSKAGQLSGNFNRNSRQNRSSNNPQHLKDSENQKKRTGLRVNVIPNNKSSRQTFVVEDSPPRRRSALNKERSSKEIVEYKDDAKSSSHEDEDDAKSSSHEDEDDAKSSIHEDEDDAKSSIHEDDTKVSSNHLPQKDHEELDDLFNFDNIKGDLSNNNNLNIKDNTENKDSDSEPERSDNQPFEFENQDDIDDEEDQSSNSLTYHRTSRPRRKHLTDDDDEDNHYSFRRSTRQSQGGGSHLKSREERLRNRQRRKGEMGSEEDNDIYGLDRFDDLDEKYRLREKSRNVDYSKFYLPKKAIQSQQAREVVEFNNHGGYRPGKWNGSRKTRGSPFKRSNVGFNSVFTFGPKDIKNFQDSDEDRMAGGGGGANRGGPSSSQKVTVEPYNIVELLRAQQDSMIKDLGDDEKEKFLENSRLYQSNSSKGLTDTDPLVSNVTIDFESIGGLEDHISTLKEMVVVPLLYPEIFSSFKISPPRGVLFHGPPGTGKTLMARALASSCSTSTQKVAFFMRKGADILSKWVGESERQLHLLFEQAKAWQPSIIFFDEVDGLAPVRSSKQDQIHSSIVSTLLALMDGLDSRGQVIVIGATNRIDAIDPALRRPGRFDREFYFPLPPLEARRKITEICTKEWKPALPIELVDDIAKETRGYCGADVKALCTEAALNAVRRQYPEIYTSIEKLQINVNNIRVTRSDFNMSMKKIVPSTKRSGTVYAQPLPSHVLPLLDTVFAKICGFVDLLLPIIAQQKDRNALSLDGGSAGRGQASVYYSFLEPRVLISGNPGLGQRYVGAAILEKFQKEMFYIQALDLQALLTDSGRSIEAALIQNFHEIKRHSPAVIYLPNVDKWWESLPDTTRNLFKSLLSSLHCDSQIIIIAFSNISVQKLDTELREMFVKKSKDVNTSDALIFRKCFEVGVPTYDNRYNFFSSLSTAIKQRPFKKNLQPTQTPNNQPRILPRAAPPPPRVLNALELSTIKAHDDSILRQLRMELRTITSSLKKDKNFRDFSKQVDLEVYPTYHDEIETPMHLQLVSLNINQGKYLEPQDWIDDIELIVDNTCKFNDDKSIIVDKVMHFRDMALMMIEYLSPEFVFECRQVALRSRMGFKGKQTTRIKDTVLKTGKEDDEVVKNVENIEKIDDDDDVLSTKLNRQNNRVMRSLSDEEEEEEEDTMKLDITDIDNHDNLDNNEVVEDMQIIGGEEEGASAVLSSIIVQDSQLTTVSENENKNLDLSEFNGDVNQINQDENQHIITETQLDFVDQVSTTTDMNIDEDPNGLNNALPIEKFEVDVVEEDKEDDSIISAEEESVEALQIFVAKSTENLNVVQLEEVGLILAGVVFRMNSVLDRNDIVEEIKKMLPVAIALVDEDDDFVDDDE